MKKYGAEFFGTFWLVLGGCGSAVLAAAFPQLGIGFLGVSLAFGLTVLTMAFAIGHISGCHLNPAVSIGLWAGGRFPAKDLAPYIVSQVLGGIAALAHAVVHNAAAHPDDLGLTPQSGSTLMTMAARRRGSANAPGASVQQANPQPLFQRCQTSANRRRCDIKGHCCTGQTFMAHQFTEKCKVRQLLQIPLQF